MCLSVVQCVYKCSAVYVQVLCSMYISVVQYMHKCSAL